MINQNYSFEDLPVKEMESVGLIKDGRFNVTQDVQDALLAGRRTSMLRLENLQTEGLRIEKLDAKISLRPNEDGILELLLHPIYKEAPSPSYLSDMDAEELQSGRSSSIAKDMVDNQGVSKKVLVEYDQETNEFVVTDTERLTVPELVNNMELTAEQKQRYRKGKEVEIPDGTIIQHTAIDSHSIRSNKLALIASVIVDGGLSFILFKGLSKLFNQPANDRERAKLSDNYKEALNDTKVENRIFMAKQDVESNGAKVVQRGRY